MSFGREKRIAKANYLEFSVARPVLTGHLPKRVPSETDVAGENLNRDSLVEIGFSRGTSGIGDAVYVCENPTVVDVAVHRLGNKSKPLVCIDGQPKTASRLLLNLLSETGTAIHYHTDFDWEGLRIANLIMSRHGARSWRFGVEHCKESVSDKYKLKGNRVNAIWDHDLATAMQASGYIIHEEQVLDELIADLAIDEPIGNQNL